jgi:hypothetical protein
MLLAGIENHFTQRMNELTYDFTDKEVSSGGDPRFIEETYRRSGLKQYLEEECTDLPSPGSNRGYSAVDPAEGYLVSTIFGWCTHHPLIAFVAEAKMVAHNLMSLFLLQVLNQKQHLIVSTMRFQCIAIGSYLVKTGGKKTFKLSAKQNRQHFLEGLFSKVSNLSPLFKTSNA